MAQSHIEDAEPEIAAMSGVHGLLKELDPEAQKRVLTWVIGRLNVELSNRDALSTHSDAVNITESAASSIAEPEVDDHDGVLEGVSPVAKKWITRTGFDPNKLSAIFSFGVDDIDLVAKTVPGKSKRERMRSVFLLKGVAAYLATGAARFTHGQMKEAALHYNAFDVTNFAVHFKSFSSEVAGNKEAGYTLTARGLAGATDIIKALVGS